MAGSPNCAKCSVGRAIVFAAGQKAARHLIFRELFPCPPAIPNRKPVQLVDLTMQPVTPPTDGDLVRLMMAGSEDAFGVLYERWSPSVYRFALHMSGDQQIAEEVAQETFMSFIRQPSMFDPTRGSLVSWLLGIARNMTRRALGVAAYEEALDESADLASPSDVLNDLTRRESIEAVRQAVVTLPASYREVVVLCDLQEMDYRDAAVALECPVGTVRSRLHRARAMLITKLQGMRCLA